MTFMAVLAVILALTSLGLVRDGGDGSIDNSIKLGVLPLASNYVCASREFVLF